MRNHGHRKDRVHANVECDCVHAVWVSVPEGWLSGWEINELGFSLLPCLPPEIPPRALCSPTLPVGCAVRRRPAYIAQGVLTPDPTAIEHDPLVR